MKLALGIGCDRGTPAATIAEAVAAALGSIHATTRDVVAIASIDLKADEAGLLEYAASLGKQVAFHPAVMLARVEVPNPSETVRKYTGTPSVSEAAALLAANADMSALLVEKYKLRGADGRNATISIARIHT
jgi:cobalt-precorrin 5A hydrolase